MPVFSRSLENDQKKNVVCPLLCPTPRRLLKLIVHLNMLSLPKCLVFCHEKIVIYPNNYMMTLNSLTEDNIVVYLCTHITAQNMPPFPISYDLNLLELLMAMTNIYFLKTYLNNQSHISLLRNCVVFIGHSTFYSLFYSNFHV